VKKENLGDSDSESVEATMDPETGKEVETDDELAEDQVAMEPGMGSTG
jgi:hypothetical protein